MNGERTWKFNSVSFCSLSIVCQKPSNGWIENVTGKAYLRQISPSPKFVPEYKDVPPPPPHCKRQYEGGLVVFPVPIHIRGKMGRRKFRMAKQSSANKRLHLWFKTQTAEWQTYEWIGKRVIGYYNLSDTDVWQKTLITCVILKYLHCIFAVKLPFYPTWKV